MRFYSVEDCVVYAKNKTDAEVLFRTENRDFDCIRKLVIKPLKGNPHCWVLNKPSLIDVLTKSVYINKGGESYELKNLNSLVEEGVSKILGIRVYDIIPYWMVKILKGDRVCV